VVTKQEIERRVAEADTARSTRRSAAAQRVGELAHRRAAIAEQLSDIERELGEVLAEASDVIALDELARFTDIPAADLTRWLGARKTTRPKRKKPASPPGANHVPNRAPSSTPAPSRGPTSPPPTPSGSGDGTTNRPATAEVP
jgi:hypothetical protein